jgi:hypothetical protein
MGGWPCYRVVKCDTYAPVEEIEAVTSGSTSLRYDPTSQQFEYNRQTPRSPGACMRLDVKFTDGQMKSANFRLR